ncbi:hypothetical protein, partial [Coleofasciculus sp.]|uniref:hypothetical protein n=1 Tax=Coleofasciculus sp. TaxID=3100458 RepID=UPI0039FA82D0
GETVTDPTDAIAPGVEEASTGETVTNSTDATIAPGVEEPVTGETVTDNIFARIQVGDLVCRTSSNGDWGTVGVVTKKSFNPRQVNIYFRDTFGSPKERVASPEGLEAMRIQIVAQLRAGLRVKYHHWAGLLSSKLKNGKWHVLWDGIPGKGLRNKNKYGEPPKKAILPQDLEIIDPIVKYEA